MSRTAVSEMADEPRTWRSIQEFVSGRWSRLSGIAFTSLISGVTEAAFLVVLARVAFSLTEKADSIEMPVLGRIGLGTGLLISLCLVLLRLVAGVLGNSQSAALIADVVADNRRALASAFLRSSWEVQQGERVGKLQELLTTYSAQGATLIMSLIAAIAAGFSLVALIATAVAVDPIGAGLVVVTIAVLSTFLKPLRSMVRGRAKTFASSGMSFATSLGEISQLGLEVQVFHVQEQTERLVDERIVENARWERRLRASRGLVPVIYVTLAYLAVVGGLAAVRAAGSDNVASIGAVMLVMLRSLSYGQNLQNSTANVTSNMPFVKTMQEQLRRYRAAERVDDGETVGHVGVLEARDASFAYVPGTPVLADLNFAIQPREVIGIVGPSGGGKSTLVQLLLGLRRPDSGDIYAADRSLSRLSRAEWARKVTFVPQSASLIAGSVADNIRFLRDDVSDEAIHRAAELAHLAADVATFDGGYGRDVGERGGHLSGGQQQRLCIARALVEDPDILILDEPTSALDMRSEHLIRQTLGQLREDMTIIIIAHRLSTLDICDRIMVIQDGRVMGFDTPDHLAATNDFYNEALILSGLK